MRQIFFRGRTKEGRMVYGDLITLKQNGEESKEVCGIRENDLLRTVHICDRGTVGQYTGLTDKNGKKIFEGDIVMSEYFLLSNPNQKKRYGIVEYGEFNCSCCNGVFGWHFGEEDIREHEGYVVIGNIYDNPELLEGTT